MNAKNLVKKWVLEKPSMNKKTKVFLEINLLEELEMNGKKKYKAKVLSKTGLTKINAASILPFNTAKAKYSYAIAIKDIERYITDMVREQDYTISGHNSSSNLQKSGVTIKKTNAKWELKRNATLDLWQCVNQKRNPLFAVNIWNNGVQRKSNKIPTTPISAVMVNEAKIAQNISALLSDCEMSSDIDASFHAFRATLKVKQNAKDEDILDALLKALFFINDSDNNKQKKIQFAIQKVQDGDHLFFVSLQAKKQPDFLSTPKTELSKYYKKSALGAYKKAGTFMREQFENVYVVWLKNDSAIQMYPVFFFGITDARNAAGVFVMRSDT